MEKRKLGSSGIKVNPLGLGCMRLSAASKWLDGADLYWNGPDESTSIRLMRTAADMGIDLFDTSNVYGSGQNEEALGKALSGMRDKVVIVTKFGHMMDESTRTFLRATATPPSYTIANTFPALIKWQCEQSLRRLQTDYIDTFLCHVQMAENGEEMMGALEELVEEGKIRSYGWSTDLADRAEIFSKGKNGVAIELRLNVVDNENECLAVCERSGMAALVRSPLGGGVLGKTAEDVSQDADKARQVAKLDAVRDVLTSDGRSVVQGALCWLWAKSECVIPIPGFRTLEQLEGLYGALQFGPLKPEQMAEIETIQTTD